MGKGCVYSDILPSTSIYLMSQKYFQYICRNKIIVMSTGDYINGLSVKNGRLINDRPDSMSGIQRAASIKRAVENDRKINLMAEAIQLAENKKNFNQLEY